MKGKDKDMKRNGKQGKKRESGNVPFWKRWYMLTLYRIVAAVAVLTFVIFYSLDFITRHNRELVVPSFVGMDMQSALAAAESAGVRLSVTDSVYLSGMDRGLIYRQNPAAGSSVKKNRRIFLTINSVNPKLVVMPDVVGYSLRQAKAEITLSGLRVGKLVYVNDMATNNVLRQNHDGKPALPGEKIEAESEIDLVLGLSQDDRFTYAPCLTGQYMPSARDMIIESSLNVGRMHFDETVKTYTDSITALVYRQNPVADNTVNIPIGSKVDIYLTKDQDVLDAHVEKELQEARLKEEMLRRQKEEAEKAAVSDDE